MKRWGEEKWHDDDGIDEVEVDDQIDRKPRENKALTQVEGQEICQTWYGWNRMMLYTESLNTLSSYWNWHSKPYFDEMKMIVIEEFNKSMPLVESDFVL